MRACADHISLEIALKDDTLVYEAWLMRVVLLHVIWIIDYTDSQRQPLIPLGVLKVAKTRFDWLLRRSPLQFL